MTAEKRTRVLIVDDSAFARKVVRESLAKAPDIEVVGIARDGLDALDQCASLRPDVVTLDLTMPELDGLGVLAALSNDPAAPRVVLVSSSAIDSDIAVEALELGAVALVQKPTLLATDRMYELGEELIRQVRIAASSRSIDRTVAPPDTVELSEVAKRSRSTTCIIVVGTSTGGPHALTVLLGALPSDLPVPLAAVVHIPPGYTETLAQRIDQKSALNVVEARHGLEIHAGTAVIARAGIHLHLERIGETSARCRLDPEPVGTLHRPSVDVLFASAARAFGQGVLAAVLTGMGDDGCEGAREIKRRGGTVLTEHASTCVVDGMPRAVVEAGLSDAQARLERMPAALLTRL